MSVRKVLGGFSSVLGGNLAVLLFNALLIFGVPLFLGAEAYGYWQLFQLYTLVLGYVTFGVTDGVHLRYSGRDYASLDYPLFRSVFWQYVLIIVTTNLAIGVVYAVANPPGVRVEVMWYACLGALLFIPRTLLTMTMQATFRMAAYSLITASERLIVLVLTFGLLLGGVRDVVPLLQADIAGKLIALILAMVVGRSGVWGKFAAIRPTVKELSENVRVGISVLVANLAAMLVPAIARWVIEANWSIETFGAVSLAFNTANIVLVAVTSMAVAVFPWLRRLDEHKLREIYLGARPIVMAGMLSILVLCAPVTALAARALPEYSEGLRFLALMFPVFVFEAQMRLLGANYLKALRRERTLMVWNVAGVMLVLLLAVVAGFVYQQLEWVVLSVFIATVVRSSLIDASVRRMLGIRWSAFGLLEVGVTVIFMAATWSLGIGQATAVVAGAVAFYLVLAARQVVGGYRRFRRLTGAQGPLPETE